MFHALAAMGIVEEARRAPTCSMAARIIYRVYETKDGKHFSVGAIEPQFYKELLERADIRDQDFEAQTDHDAWKGLSEKMDAIFKTKTRAEWTNLLEGSDACAMAVQTLHEAPDHPHLKARETFVVRDGKVQPAPAPRFSRTPRRSAHRRRQVPSMRKMHSPPGHDGVTIAFERITPVLRIWTSPRQADEFYLGFLGCGIDWEHRSMPMRPCTVRSRAATWFCT